jgi:hypothetical protein
MLADISLLFSLVPFSPGSSLCVAWLAVAGLVAIVLVWHDLRWASITACHSPAISTSELRNLSYKLS